MIRAYRASDRDAVRAICVETALYGRPITPLIPDARLAADALSSFYTDIEPESLFVAEERGAVAGYLFGCLDSRRFGSYAARRIAPRCAAAFVAGGLFLRPGALTAAAALLAAAARRWRVMRGIVPSYPAHCHVNVAEGCRGRGIGAALWCAFRGRLESRAVPGVHVTAATGAGKRFFGRQGFRLLARLPAPALGGVAPGDMWIMGFDVAA